MRSIQLSRIARKIKILLDSLLRVMIMGTLHTGWNNAVHKDSSSLAAMHGCLARLAINQ